MRETVGVKILALVKIKLFFAIYCNPQANERKFRNISIFQKNVQPLILSVSTVS